MLFNTRNINILGMRKAKWPNFGSFSTDKRTLYYYGSNDNKYRHDEAIVINKELNGAMKDYFLGKSNDLKWT